MTVTQQARVVERDWLDDALSTRADSGEAVVHGARIAYRVWESSGARDILLIHGGGAHARWWDAIAPSLLPFGRVAALDLSGHGDSDHREQYALETWGDEALAVSAVAGLVDPVVVGHSLGGLITVALMRRSGTTVREAIIVDSPLGGPSAETLPEAAELRTVGTRTYATADEAVARFRPVPAQPMVPRIAEHVGRLAVREVGDGFTWKYDRRIFTGGNSLAAGIPERADRLAFFRAELGLAPASVRSEVEAAGGVYVELPGAGHAPMLDQPLALITGIRTVLEMWAQRP